MCIAMVVQAAVDLAQQTTSSSQGGIGPDGWKIITVLGGFIAGLIVWIKALIAKIDGLNDARIQDLKDNSALFREDIKDGKFDGKS